MASDGRLDIRFFGGLHLTFAGEPWDLKVSKGALWLLAYLLLHRNAPLQREVIAFKLAPDVPEERAKARLRSYLNELKKALPPRPGDSPWIVADKTTVGWNREAPFWFDVGEFEEASDARSSVEAVALYSGPLLADVDIGERDWLEPFRQEFLEQQKGRLRKTIEEKRAAGDLEATVAHVGQLRSVDPYDEWAIRALMQAHHAAGDRALAARTYNDAVKLFAAEELELSAETKALYDRVVTTDAPATPSTVVGPTVDVALHDRIPAQLTPFIGRENELAEAVGALGGTRLLTLAGTGGVGKTRLAIQLAEIAAERFPDGRWFIDFGPLSDPAFVTSAILSTIGLHEESGRTIQETLVHNLRDKQALIILDNCEHVVAEVARSAERLLQGCPQLTMVVTSREILKVGGEVVHRIRTFSEDEGIRLFESRAKAVQPNFTLDAQTLPIVKQICARVEGIPLAIELAAARMRMMTAQELWKRLDDRFRILTGGSRTALPRQQTLHGLIGWSYNLLRDDEKALLRRLAVFSGDFAMEAATSVCGFHPLSESAALELISELIDKSLVHAEQSANVQRYRLLESTKAYGLERLDEAGEWETAQQRHARYFLSIAEAAESLHGTPRYDEFREQTSHDYADYRAVLQRELLERGDVRVGAALAAALARYWMERGLWREGRYWLELVVQREAKEVPLETLAMAWLGLAGQYYVAGDYDVMGSSAARAEQVYATVGDLRGQGRARIQLAIAATYAGEFEKAADAYNGILEIARELSEPRMEAVALQNLAEVLSMWKGDYEESERLYARAVAIHRERGDSRSLSTALGDWSQTAADRGAFDRANALATESLDICRQVGDETRIVEQLIRIGRYRVWANQSDAAAAPLGEAVRRLRGSLHPLFFARCIDGCAELATARERYETAATLLGFGDAWREAKRLPRAGDYASRSATIREGLLAKLGQSELDARSASGAGMPTERIFEFMTAALGDVVRA